MAGVYIGDCKLRPVQDKSPWWRKIVWPPIIFEVAETFAYKCRYGTVKVEAGFLTDGASVPRPFRWLFPAVGNYLRAAVVHDAALKQEPRDVANDIFLEALIDDEVGSGVAGILYLAVSAFGKMKSLIERIKR